MGKVKPKSIAIEFDDIENRITNICILDNAGTFHIFAGIQVENELTIPEPYGCEFVVTDISNRQLATAKFEIEFLSGYSREGVFYATTYSTKNAT